MVLLWQKQNDIGKMVFAINAKITLATGEVLYWLLVTGGHLGKDNIGDYTEP